MSDGKMYIVDEKKDRLPTPEELRELDMRKFFARINAQLGITRQDLEDDPFVVCRAFGDALEAMSELVIGSEHGDVFMVSEWHWYAAIELFPIRMVALMDYNWVGDSLDPVVGVKDPDGRMPIKITDYSTRDQFSWTIWVKGEEGECPVDREYLS